MRPLRYLRHLIHKVLNRLLVDNSKFNLSEVLHRLGSLGENCRIDATVKFKGNLKNIHIGNRATISGDVILDCDSPQSKITIGDNCVILGPCQLLTYGGYIVVGSNVSFNPFCIIYGHGGLTVGNFVRVAAHTVIIPANHVFEDPETPITSQGLTKEGIVIGDDVWVGSGVRILDGSKVGKGSVLGCSTVVNNIIEDYSVVVGIPGKKIKSRNK